MHRFFPILVVVSLVIGCDRNDEAPVPEPSADVATSATHDEAPAVELEPSIPRANVTALLDAWLAAQNEGNFASYAALYADEFEGIKRVGPRMYRYAHDGWLEDRKRMFKKKINVSADDVRLQTSPSTAMIVFEQTWASGSYEDVGPKQLIVTKTPDGLRIAREEMVASHVTSQKRATRAYDPQAFALVADGGVVLDIAPKRAWATGRARIVTRPYTATKDVDVAASGFGEWIGRDVELFGPDGTSCGAKIIELDLIARIIPHFGTIDWWNGTLSGKRRSDAYVAAEIWNKAAESPYGDARGIELIGRLDNKCDGALWARPKGGAAEPIPAQRLEGPALRNVVAAFTDLPGYHTEQTEYDSYGHRGAWHEDKDAQVSFTRFGQWVLGAAHAGYGCGGFEGGFWAIWRSAGQDSLVLQTDDEQPNLWHFSPVAAAQLGEAVYFVEPERVVSRVNDSWQLLWDATTLNFDCGC